ncbi:MAG: phosphomethylpyrimidine synthase ThiC [Lentisphaerae bacterium]|nr:phosphomethylpyrimidine synthase ThiC [Lentisphaerota bacterium]
MKTQYEQALAGRISPQMTAAACSENVPARKVRDELAAGRAVLPANPAHVRLQPAVVGRAFRTKVNANIGRSAERSSLRGEMRKLQGALAAGADCLMDLSVGPRLIALRRQLLSACRAPFGTVPVYEALNRAENRIEALTEDLLLRVIAEQAEQGVDFMTLHAGLRRSHLRHASRRLAGIVSRGGAVLALWMRKNEKENPLYTAFDGILDICRAHDVTLSLGDGLRPGCLADAGDKAQYAELKTLGELVRRSRRRGVQVMVEGPGHVPFDRIREQMDVEARWCDGAPFYVLGPVVTDVAPGYDHISAAIGATAAAFHGASLLCYVTPAEHLGLPTAAEVHEGVMAFRIAAHAADVAKGLPGARDWDDAMTRARVTFDWKRQFEIALDGKRARKRFLKGGCRLSEGTDYCSMCGAEFCAMKNFQRAFPRRGKTEESEG